MAGECALRANPSALLASDTFPTSRAAALMKLHNGLPKNTDSHRLKTRLVSSRLQTDDSGCLFVSVCQRKALNQNTGTHEMCGN